MLFMHTYTRVLRYDDEIISSRIQSFGLQKSVSEVHQKQMDRAVLEAISI